MITPGCYKATVNESETITEAQPQGRFRSHREPRQFRDLGFRFPATPHIERS
jgi:hypothetical protein